MNWKTLSEVKNENLGHREKVHTQATEHIHFHTHAYKTTILHIYTQLYQSVHK